jgi:hypothetical protein
MLKNSTDSEMLALTNRKDSRPARWAAALILAAVCALTVSVTTRYGFSASATGPATSVQKHASAQPSRQRLLKNASTWIPPVVCTAILESPSSYPRLAPAAPPIPGLPFETQLYNRPPPVRVVLA